MRLQPFPVRPDDIADRITAIETTYADDGNGRVVVCDGFGCRVVVNHGALVVSDGVGEHRRERTYPKVRPPSRLVVAGDGMLTIEALSWCRAQGVAVVVLRAGTDVLLAASPPGRDDARLRRQQALAGVDRSPVGLAIVRHLLSAKLHGQARNLASIFGADATTSTVLDLAGGVEVAGSVDECRQLEAVAAAAYFGVWAGHPATAVGFVAKDRNRVPPHWCTYDSRRSAITGAANTNRLAERPLNALLNYCYKLAEVEARFACVRLGLDAALGCLHLDAAGRDSLALDVLEPLRPKIDAFVLDLVAERMFRKSDFVERSDGHVKVAAPLAHELAAATMPAWRREVAPHSEAVAHLFTDAVVGKTTKATPLTSRKATAAQAEVRRRKAAEARERAERAAGERRAALPVRRPSAPAPEQAAAALARCLTCGGALTRPRHVRCERCWERQGGAQSREARRRRGRSIAMARSELDAWRAEHPHAVARPEDFTAVRAGLAGVTLARIMTAAGVSKATASGWRTGRHVPALRHWHALAELAGVPLPAGIPVDPPAGASVVDLAREVELREKVLDDWEHDQAQRMMAEDAAERHVDPETGEILRVTG
ncbi:MAG TPA: CRISPR-associated endonuclease Cas1 [Acidimicrobiales bacterium]|nr:CRISPR-associated endonuclease Cas1 [Acidimicrobiales bacterium]